MPSMSTVADFPKGSIGELSMIVALLRGLELTPNVFSAMGSVEFPLESHR